MPPEVVAKLMRQQEDRRRFGDVREPISVEFADHRIVAVGDSLHWSKKWKTFSDFLMHYIKQTLGEDWGSTELQKPLEDRHVVLQWYEALCELQANTSATSEPKADGLYESEMDGPSRAYLLLAYDLYVLRHHSALQDEVVHRLKNPSQFQGARYELFVAATMIRAGFDLDHEDETDGSTKHPEFLAKHRATGEVVAVEAKSKHRPGLLGFQPTGDVRADFGLRIRGLIRAALKKAGEEPLIVFVEANLPPELASPLSTFDLPAEVKDAVSKADITNTDSGIIVGSAFAEVLVTNTSDYFGVPGEPARQLEVLYRVRPGTPRVPVSNLRLLDEIERAVMQYGQFPQEFPDEG